MKNIYRPTQMYAMLTQDTRTVFMKQLDNLSCFQERAYYAGIKIFSNLPSDLKSCMNEKARFKIALKRYLNTHSFFSFDEYLLYSKWLICLKVT
jgi:hypothetical protein